jgi:hypothetical protein
VTKYIPMKSTDERAAFARKIGKVSTRNQKPSEIKHMPFPKPIDYPFRLRLIVVIMLVMFAINVFFFLGPATAFIAAAINPGFVYKWQALIGVLISDGHTICSNHRVESGAASNC